MKSAMLRFGGYGLLIVIAVALPFVIGSAAGRLLAITALLYAMLAASWNLTLGFGGIFNFAHVGFFGLGGYAMAISTVKWGWSGWAGVAFGIAVGAAAGLLAYLPVVRMRGIYIALITFVFTQLCFYLLLATPAVTGGSNGLPGVRPLTIGSFNLGDHSGLGFLWLTGLCTAGLLILLHVIVNSRFGHSLIALRDNESFAVSRGMNRIRQQLISFMVSGGMAGLAGALYVSYFHVADTTLFSFGFVTLGLSMIFLGGTGHIWGPVVGAIVVTFVDRQLTDLGAWQTVIIGAGTVAVLIFLPRGIAGLLEQVVQAGARSLRPRDRRTAATAAATAVVTRSSAPR